MAKLSRVWNQNVYENISVKAEVAATTPAIRLGYRYRTLLPTVIK